MNWTGGTFSRHAHSKTNTQKATQRQKFARNSLLRKGLVKKGLAIVPFSTTWMGKKPEHLETHLYEAEGGRYGRDLHDQCFTHASTVHHVPPEGTSSRKRPHSQSPVTRANPDRSEATPDHASTYVLHKRQELLKRGDWLDLGLQANVGVEFNTTRENQNVGKRRCVHRDQRMQLRERLVQGAPHIFEHKDRDVHGNLLRHRHETRIRIGDHTLTPSIRSSVLHINPAAKKLFSTASQGSHDVMLLDQSEEMGIPQSSLHGHDLLPAIRSSSYDAMLLDESGEFDEYRHGLTPTMQDHSNHEHTQRQTSRRQYQDAQHSRRPLNQGNVLRYNKLPRNTYGASNVHHFEPPSSPPIISYAQHRKLPEYLDSQEPQMFTSSSGILQPTPHTFRVARVLKSSSSYGDTDLKLNHIRASPFDDDHTTVAQIGQLEPVVHPSQQMDDKMWSSWLNIHNATRSENERDDDHADVDITPGISEMGEGATSAHDSNPEVSESERVDVHSPSHTPLLQGYATRDSIAEKEAGSMFKRPNKIWDRFEQMMADLEDKFGPLNQERNVIDIETQDRTKLSDQDLAMIESTIIQKKEAIIKKTVVPPRPKSNPQNQEFTSYESPSRCTAHESTNNTRKLLASRPQAVFQELSESNAYSRLRSRPLTSPEPWVKFTFDNNLSSNSSLSRSPESTPPNLSQYLSPSSSLRAHASTSAAETTPQSLELPDVDSLPTSQGYLDQNHSSRPSQMKPQSLQATYDSDSTPVSTRNMSSVQPAAPRRSKSTHNHPKPFQSVDFMASSPDPLSIGHD